MEKEYFRQKFPQKMGDGGAVPPLERLLLWQTKHSLSDTVILIWIAQRRASPWLN